MTMRLGTAEWVRAPPLSEMPASKTGKSRSIKCMALVHSLLVTGLLFFSTLQLTEDLEFFLVVLLLLDQPLVKEPLEFP